jgi:Domain of unknown function (DUF6046)/DNA circularisation protein N-terminus
MSISLDSIKLVQRLAEDNKDIRNISFMKIEDKRSIIELEIPGSEGNILQDMGSDSVKISIVGELMGEDVVKGLESLQEKFQKNDPVPFSSDISGITEISKVIIEQLYIEQIQGNSSRFKYNIILLEYVEPKS